MVLKRRPSSILCSQNLLCWNLHILSTDRYLLSYVMDKRQPHKSHYIVYIRAEWMRFYCLQIFFSLKILQTVSEIHWILCPVSSGLKHSRPGVSIFLFTITASRMRGHVPANTYTRQCLDTYTQKQYHPYLINGANKSSNINWIMVWWSRFEPSQ
jgi:hypothetical protein